MIHEELQRVRDEPRRVAEDKDHDHQDGGSGVTRVLLFVLSRPCTVEARQVVDLRLLGLDFDLRPRFKVHKKLGLLQGPHSV